MCSRTTSSLRRWFITPFKISMQRPWNSYRSKTNVQQTTRHRFQWDDEVKLLRLRAPCRNMRSFATWRVMRRDKSKIELTVSSFFFKTKRERGESSQQDDDSDTALWTSQWSNDPLTMQNNRSHPNELMPIDIQVKIEAERERRGRGTGWRWNDTPFWDECRTYDDQVSSRS